MLFLPLFQLNIKKNIPNTITLGNLLCGCLAIIKVFEGDLVWASYLVGIAAVCDFFDGFAARLLKVSSPIGKDLDSLADMVTFGVVPGVIMYRLIEISFGIGQAWRQGFQMFENPYAYCAFIIPLFSAVRLAKFNNDTRQAESFIGLPTPANAILLASFPVILYFGGSNSVLPFDPNYILTGPHAVSQYNDFFLNKYFLLSLCVINSLLLVAPIPLFALKFKNFKWKGNEIRFVFLIWSVLLLAMLQFTGIPLIILSYILFSLVNNLLKKSKSNPDTNH